MIVIGQVEKMTCNPCGSISEDNPSVQRRDKHSNYGSISENEGSNSKS